MADDRKKLDGGRFAIREHIHKQSNPGWNEGERNFALKTIRNTQAVVVGILKDHPHWVASWEDKWIPGQPVPKDAQAEFKDKRKF